MKHEVLFIQGGGGQRVHDDWDAKLVDSLERELGSGYAIDYPRMPHEDDPSYADWKPAIERQFARLEDGAILVGHSIGAAIMLRALADDPPELALAGIFLIAAPFVGDGGWPSDDMESFRDLGAKLPRRTPIYFYHGDQDKTVPFEHLGLYAQVIPRAVVRELSGRDHQLDNDLSEVAADIRRLAG